MKRFRFRFTVSQTFETTLTEDQIYPDYPWNLYPEHAKAKKGQRLTMERVEETVRKNGGADTIIDDWRLDPSYSTESKVIGRRVRLKIEQLPSLPRKKAPR